MTEKLRLPRVMYFSVVKTMFSVTVEIEACLTEIVIVACGALVAFADDRTSAATMARVTQMNRGLLSVLSRTYDRNWLCDNFSVLFNFQVLTEILV